MRHKRKNKKNKNMIQYVIIVLVTVILVLLVSDHIIKKIYVKSNPQNHDKTKEEVKENFEKIKKTTYYKDVDYTGETFLEEGLFEIPFDTASENEDSHYVSNKEFVTTVSENTLEQIQNTSKKYIGTILNTGYKRIKNNQDEFINSVKKLSYSDCFYNVSEETSTVQFAENVMSWYIDNEIQIESDFVTDRCLIYSNGKVVNRGELHFTVYSGKDLSKLEELIGIENIKIGKEYIVYLEVYYIPLQYNKVQTVSQIGLGGNLYEDSKE